MQNQYRPIRYDREWDKLRAAVGSKYTTIRERYSYNYGRVMDKMDYYKTGTIYQQIILNKPEFLSRLFGIENIPGDKIPEFILKKDVTYNGIVDEQWYKKVKGMKEALLLHFKKISDKI